MILIIFFLKLIVFLKMISIFEQNLLAVMKNNLFKILAFTFLLLTDFVVFAQGPGTQDESLDNLEGGDTAAPINAKLVWLGVAAIVFAIYSFKRKPKQA